MVFLDEVVERRVQGKKREWDLFKKPARVVKVVTIVGCGGVEDLEVVVVCHPGVHIPTPSKKQYSQPFRKGLARWRGRNLRVNTLACAWIAGMPLRPTSPIRDRPRSDRRRPPPRSGTVCMYCTCNYVSKSPDLAATSNIEKKRTYGETSVFGKSLGP